MISQNIYTPSKRRPISAPMTTKLHSTVPQVNCILHSSSLFWTGTNYKTTKPKVSSSQTYIRESPRIQEQSAGYFAEALKNFEPITVDTNNDYIHVGDHSTQTTNVEENMIRDKIRVSVRLSDSTTINESCDISEDPISSVFKDALESCESMMDPGYKSYNSTNNNTPRIDQNVTEESPQTQTDTTDKMSKVILELIRPNSRVGNLILQSATNGQHSSELFKEIKQCIQAEFKETHFKSAIIFGTSDESLKNLNDSLDFVKEHLALIKADFSKFRENCWLNIDSKVSLSEYSDTTSELRSVITDLEQKLFNEQRVMRQDIRGFQEKIQKLSKKESSIQKYFSFWPVVAFIGAYSLMKFGQR